MEKSKFEVKAISHHIVNLVISNFLNHSGTQSHGWKPSAPSGTSPYQTATETRHSPIGSIERQTAGQPKAKPRNGSKGLGVANRRQRKRRSAGQACATKNATNRCYKSPSRQPYKLLIYKVFSIVAER